MENLLFLLAVVDTQGFPHALAMTPANTTDREGGGIALASAGEGLFGVQIVLVDGGYTGEPFATSVDTLLGARVEVVKRNE
jgi:transposase